MNQRIRELYSQAGLTMNNPLAYEQWYLNSLEKFAELVVKDCRDMFRVGSVSWNLLNEKLEHFGVEQ